MVDADRFLGVHVHDLHEPAGTVGADGNHHQIEWPASPPDFPELGMIGRVAREVEPEACRLESKPAPERPVAVAEAAGAEVPRRSTGHPDALDAGILPPVQLDQVPNAPGPSVRGQAERSALLAGVCALTHLVPLVLLNGSGTWSGFDTAQLEALAQGSLSLFGGE
jgi:hypothetical protein